MAKNDDGTENKLGWRPIKAEDIKRGTVVRLTGLEAYNDCTIIAVVVHDLDNEVWLARPTAFADKNYDDTQPLMYCEIVKVSSLRMVREADRYLVMQDRNSVRSMLT